MLNKKNSYLVFIPLIAIIWWCTLFNKPTPEFKSVYNNFFDNIKTTQNFSTWWVYAQQDKITLKSESKFMTGNFDILLSWKTDFSNSSSIKSLLNIIFSTNINVPFGTNSQNIWGSWSIDIQVYSWDLLFKINNFDINSSDQKVLMIWALIKNLLNKWISTKWNFDFTTFVQSLNFSNPYYSQIFVNNLINWLQQWNIFDNKWMKRDWDNYIYSIELNKNNLISTLNSFNLIESGTNIEQLLNEIKFTWWLKTKDGNNISLIIEELEVAWIISINWEIWKNSWKINLSPSQNLKSKLTINYTKSENINFEIKLTEDNQTIISTKWTIKKESNENWYKISISFELESQWNKLNWDILHQINKTQIFEIWEIKDSIPLEWVLDNLWIKSKTYTWSTNLSWDISE